MARVPRRRRSMAKHRRSREERRRLSEGGGGSAPHPPPAAEEAIPEVVAQVEVQRLTAKEIEVAYQTVFHYAEEYENILVEQAFYECEIERLLDIKSFVDDKLSKVKVKNKDPDSDNIKNIRTLTKKSMELQESADMVKIQLNETRLMKTELEAHFRSSLSLIDQHVAHEDDEDRLFLGCLAYVLMME